MNKSSANKMLESIGFTVLESDIYVYLLTQGANTGYGVAKGVGKAVANVYKALDILAKKGAVEQASGKSKQYIAVPWEQLISTETKKFEANMDGLAKALKQIPSHQEDEQIYHMQNADQVKEQSVRIIEKAGSIILADLEPKSLEWLKQPLIDAALRGVEVRVKIYEDADLPNVHLVLRKQGKQIYDKTRYINFGICADGQDMITGILTHDSSQVVQAFRSKSALMNLTIYNKLLYELVLTELKDVIPRGELQEAQKILSDTEHLHPFSNENLVFQSFKNRYQNDI